MTARKNASSVFCQRQELLRHQRQEQELRRQQRQAELAPLRDQIREDLLRGRWFSEHDLGVLITIALLRSDEPFMSRHEIFSWIISNSKYYAQKVGDKIANHVGRSPRIAYEKFIPGFEASLIEYELRLEDFGELLPRQARACLMNMKQDVLYPTAEGESFRFRFLDLPPEMRAVVYELLFAFPTITFDKRSVVPKDTEFEDGRYYLSAPTRLHVQRRAWGTHLEAAEHYSLTQRSSYRTRPLNNILDMLCVSKFIYREALPVFYSTNHFNMVELQDFALFTRVLAPSRLAYVRSISLNYMPDNATVGLATAIDRLYLHPGFRNIEIRIRREEAWFEIKSKTKKGDKVKYAEAGQVPGLKELARVFRRSVKIVFVGYCPKIVKYVKESLKGSKTLIVAPYEEGEGEQGHKSRQELEEEGDDFV